VKIVATLTKLALSPWSGKLTKNQVGEGFCPQKGAKKMTDNVTKLLLAAIALGLWANAAPHMVPPAKAQSMDKNLMDSVNNINTNLKSIDGRLAVFIEDLHLGGRCQNRQLCRR
jgi:hypothetical protein